MLPSQPHPRSINHPLRRHLTHKHPITKPTLLHHGISNTATTRLATTRLATTRLATAKHAKAAASAAATNAKTVTIAKPKANIPINPVVKVATSPPANLTTDDQPNC